MAQLLLETPAFFGASGDTEGWCCWIDRGSLFPYSKNVKIFQCPSDYQRRAKNVINDPTDYPLSYSANDHLNLVNPGLSPKRASRIMLLIHESRDTINDGLCAWILNWNDMPSNVHYDGTTVSFLDCHSAYLSHKELMRRRSSGEWDPGFPFTEEPRAEEKLAPA